MGLAAGWDSSPRMLAGGIAALHRLVMASYMMTFAALWGVISPGPEFQAYNLKAPLGCLGRHFSCLCRGGERR
jgi:hypothetical protein